MAKNKRSFNAQVFLASGRAGSDVTSYGKGDTVFSQGDSGEHVLYIQKGGVQLSKVSTTGRQVLVARLGPGTFFGEGCLTGQSVRRGTATATAGTRILAVPKDAMIRLLSEEHTFSDRFITHMLARNIRIEQDLVDQLFNSTEKRVARALLRLAHYGTQQRPQHIVPKISQETLAEMVGTTRERAGFYMKKFRKQGFIEYNGHLRINNSLLTVVLHD